MKLTKIRCPNCGAALEFDFEKRKTVCSYCGSSMMIEQDAAELNPVLDKKQAKAKAKEEKKQAKLLIKNQKNKQIRE